MGHVTNEGTVPDDVTCGWNVAPTGSSGYVAFYLESNELGDSGTVELFNYDTEETTVISGNTSIGLILIQSSYVGVTYTLPAEEMGAFNFITHFGKCTELAPTFREMSGTINDGSFDDLYSGITKCNWIISPQPEQGHVYVITLNFDYFETTNLKDFLRIYSDNGTLLALYTGQSAPSQFTYFGNWLKLELTVGSPGYQEGFSIQYEASTECPAGYFLQNGTVCAPCNAGTYSSAGLASSCTACSAGSYSGPKASDCSLCEIGYYQLLPGQPSCLLCGLGSFSNTTGSSVCRSCIAGTFAAKEGSTTCEPCPFGEYQDRTGQRECVLCELGHYASTLASTKCLKCPANTMTHYIGTVNLTSCTCQSGYYGANGTKCTICPKGASCAGADEPATALPGYWEDRNGSYFVSCLPSSACLGGVTSECATGYRGDRCGWCEAKYWRFRDKCAACSNNTEWYYLLLIVVPLVLVFWTLQSVSKNFRSGALAITFDFIQGLLRKFRKSYFIVLSLTTAFKVNWPDKLESLFVFASTANINLDFLSLECTMGFTYWEKWFFSLSIPFIVGAVYATVLIVIQFVHYFFPKLSRNTM